MNGHLKWIWSHFRTKTISHLTLTSAHKQTLWQGQPSLSRELHQEDLGIWPVVTIIMKLSWLPSQWSWQRCDSFAGSYNRHHHHRNHHLRDYPASHASCSLHNCRECSASHRGTIGQSWKVSHSKFGHYSYHELHTFDIIDWPSLASASSQTSSLSSMSPE